MKTPIFRHSFFRIFAFAFIVLSFMLIPLSADAAIYVKFDGIDGESMDENHDKWIDVLSFSQSLNRPEGNQASGRARTRSRVMFDNIELTKELDSSSTKLMENIAMGKVIPEATVEFTRRGGEEGNFVFLTYELKNVMVTSYDISGSEEEVPQESFSLNFEEIKVTYKMQDQKTGKEDKKFEFSWNLSKGEKGK